MKSVGWLKNIALLSAIGLGSGGAWAGGSVKDYYSPQTFSWTGFYVGAHAGLGTGTTSSSTDLGGLFTLNTDYDMSGALWGGHIGYNRQFGNTVLGVEGTWASTEIEGSTSCVLILKCGRNVDSVATLVGRLGFAMDRAMVYGLAGVAWGDVETNTTDNIIGIFKLSGDETHVGWVAGVGVEYAISPNILARVEYNHIDFGSETHNLTANLGGMPMGSLPSKVDLNIDTIKIGVSYKFN